jgi:Rho family protein
VFENYVELMQVEDQAVELSLWDTAGQSCPKHFPSEAEPIGQEDFDRLRSLSYADTHVVMLCFSVDSPTSLENTESRWIDEINEHCQGVKVILIGGSPFP